MQSPRIPGMLAAMRPLRSLLLPALCLSAAALTLGCKTKIPEDFQRFVPEEHSDAVQMAVQSDDNDYGADEMLLITYEPVVPDAKLMDIYAKHIEAAGFTRLTTCEIDGEPVSADFVKAPAEHVQVYVRLPSKGDNGPMLHLFHSAKLHQLGGAENCEFTDAAQELCATLEDTRCVLPE